MAVGRLETLPLSSIRAIRVQGTPRSETARGRCGGELREEFHHRSNDIDVGAQDHPAIGTSEQEVQLDRTESLSAKPIRFRRTV